MIKVLIVEDDPMVADINTRYINSVEGFEVVEIVGDGASAIGYCQKREVDLAIVDIFMPRMDGIQLIHEIRKRYSDVDVIFVTASREMKHIDEGLKMGAVDYLIKPFEYERLRQALEKYRDRYRLVKNQKELTQDEVDQHMLQVAGKTKQLKKGLHEKTLERIRNYMKTQRQKGLSSEVIADELQISKVTVRRYLEYMEEAGEIKKEIVYGAVGRPSYLYYCL